MKNGNYDLFGDFYIKSTAFRDNKPIDLHCYSSRILAPLNIIIPILDEANQGCLLIEPILNKIIEHLGPSSCKKLEDTKEFRAHVRKAMIKEESE
ncbi:unnamed protein product [Rotaria sp. Silwood2]|nr:unnamed protein product [Rotaria sp. Silwood2]